MTEQEKKQALADALRRYPHFGDAYLDALEALNDVWGSLLAYYTDMPEVEVQRLIALCERLAGDGGGA